MVEHVRRLMCGTWSNFSDLRGVMITIPTHETVTFDNTNQGPGCPRISLRMGIQLDAVAHGALICGYFGMGKVSLALRFQTEIVKWNCSPNVITRAKMKTCRFILFCSGLLDIGFVSYGVSMSHFQSCGTWSCVWMMHLKKRKTENRAFCPNQVGVFCAPPIQRKLTSSKVNSSFSDFILGIYCFYLVYLFICLILEFLQIIWTII